jgi:hypothetical protein
MAYTTIDDPSAHFQTTLYTGNRSSSQTITNDGNSDLKPDWLWIKPRNDTVAHSHSLFDSTRGVTKGLASNISEAEYTTTSKVTSFNTDGFSIGNGASVNQPDRDVDYAAWQWKANGGSTSSNTDGSITSTVQANTTAGFSIVLWTGDASNTSTVGHGLGVAPKIIIIKNRSDNADWAVCGSFSPLGINKRVPLNGDGAVSSPSDILEALPTTALFQPGNSNDSNGSSDDMIAYCFAEKQGYSKIGSYTGNGNADGAFVYTGFKPAWLMIKRTDSTGNWFIFDNKREGYNPDNDRLIADSTLTEADPGESDLLSNGFKLRFTSGNVNGSGGTYIYMAFAEHPFVSSKGVPVTAR